MMLKKYLIFALLMTYGLVGYAQESRPAGVPAASKELEFEAFTRLRVKGNFRVHLLPQAEAPQVFIQLPEELEEHLELAVKGDALELAWARKSRFQLPTQQAVQLWVCASELEALEVYGSGLIEGKALEAANPLFQLNVSGSGSIKLGKLQADRLKADVTGSGHISVEQVASKQTELSISGSGHIELGGSSQEANLAVVGSGKIQAKQLKATHCEAKITGSGFISTAPSQKLTASVVGSGKISYLGNPSLSIKAGSKKQIRQVKG